MQHRRILSRPSASFARIASDYVIAGVLNRNGLATGNGNRWTRERVTALRSYRKIPVFKPDAGGLDHWLNLSSAAKLLGVAPKTLRLAAEADEIEADHPLADGPWVFERTELSKMAAQHLRKRAQKNPDTPRYRTRISKTYFLQQHRKMGAMKQSCSGSWTYRSRWPHKPSGSTRPSRRISRSRSLADAQASALSPDDILQHLPVKRQVGNDLL